MSGNKAKKYWVSGKIKSFLLFCSVAVLFSSCWTLDRAARTAVDQAVSTAVEREVEAMLAGYTDVMLYQLAYTQMFHMGGFGLHHDEFEEGQGATWRLDTEEDDEVYTFTAERALLERVDDGASWWYLRYDPQDEETLEYEILVDSTLHAKEMYFRDPESGDVRHHVFDFDDREQREMQEGEESLDEAGYHTESYYIEELEEYRVDQVRVLVGAGTFDADVLRHTGEEDEDNFEFNWWVTDEVPGQLIQYEYTDHDTGGFTRGELMELRDDYTSTLAFN